MLFVIHMRLVMSLVCGQAKYRQVLQNANTFYIACTLTFPGGGGGGEGGYMKEI